MERSPLRDQVFRARLSLGGGSLVRFVEQLALPNVDRFIGVLSSALEKRLRCCSALPSLGQWAPLCAFDELLLPFAADFSIVGAVPQD